MSKSVALLLVLVFLTASSLTIIQSVKGSVENVGTSCGIFVDDIVEGQPITITVQIYPAPPAGEIFNDLFVWIASPLQGTAGNGPWGKSFPSDTDGKATVTFDIHTFSGYWNVGLSFEGQYFANNTIYYQPLQSQRGFSISAAQTPSPSPSPSPSPTPNPTPTPSPITTPTASPKPTPEPEPFPTTLAIGSAIAVVAVVGLGLLVYLKKRHKLKSD
jgi:hypothetical protein